MLAAAGVIAWLMATSLALLSKGEAVATAFVAVGAPLIGAAAFYSRVRKLTKEGVEVDPLEQLRELDASLPPPSGEVSALEERRGVLEAVEAVVAPSPSSEQPDQSLDYLNPVDRGVRSYERAMRLEQAARDWLLGEGFEIEALAADWGVDFIARCDGAVYVFEVKSSRGGLGSPTPEALRSYYLQARIWTDANIGQDEPFYRVLITDVVPPPNLRDRYRKEGIGIVRIDLDHGQADWALKPRNVR